MVLTSVIKIAAALVLFMLLFNFITVHAAHQSMLEEKHQTLCSTNSLSPNLEPGDIVWRWSYIPLVTHCLIYVGESDDNGYAFIEANSLEDVWMPVYDIEWLQSELFPTICRVKTDQTTIAKALEFATEQIGKKFAYIHEKEFDPDTEYWYCTELVWASFYSVGIDIDLNGWHRNIIFDAPVIMPYEIYFDDDIVLLQMKYT